MVQTEDLRPTWGWCVRVLGVDPGGTTGYWFYDRMVPTDWSGQVTLDKLPECLYTLSELGIGDTCDVVVVEDFALLGGKALAQIGSKFETCQAIGMFKLWAYGHGLPVVMQPPGIKPIATKWSHIKVPSNHKLSHRFDAALHAVYYQVNNAGEPSVRE